MAVLSPMRHLLGILGAVKVKMLVLDKSCLQAAPTQFLRGLRERYNFLLTTTLLEELGTEDVAERGSMTEKEKQALNLKIERRFATAVAVAGNEWIDHLQGIEWEITRGKSARFAPTMQLQLPLDLDRLLDSKTVQDCLTFDKAKASLASFAAPVRNEADKTVLASHMQTPEETFFDRLASGLASDEFSVEMRETVTALVQAGEKRGWTKSFYFFPRSDWLIYGLALAHRVYLPWKLWKYGNNAPTKAANAAYDLYYIGFMAIADGLLSLDRNMLKLAWAMWPKKRQHIYEYRDERILTFVPTWSPNSGRASPDEPLRFL